MNTMRIWILGRCLPGIAVLIVATALFYAEESWRGTRSLVNCKRDLMAHGVKLGWSDYIPSSVPDDENVFGVPEMQEWCTGRRGELFVDLFLPPGRFPDFKCITPETAPQYLKSDEKYAHRFDIIRGALERPSTQMKGSYAKPADVPFPDLLSIHALTRTIGKRAKCHQVLGQPEEALNDLSFIDSICRKLLEKQQPTTMLAAWLDGNERGFYADQIADGIRSQSWNAAQLTKLENQLKPIDLLQLTVQALKFEQVVTCLNAGNESPERLMRNNFNTYDVNRHHPWQARWNAFVARWEPRAWLYQGSAACARIESMAIDGLNPADQIVLPEKLSAAGRDFEALSPHWAPRTFLGNWLMLDLGRVCQSTAYFQTKVNETLIACALERYHLAHGEYPPTLDILVPQFIDKIPHDVIGGGALHYQRADAGTFVLYSIGWNARDDQGHPGSSVYPFSDGDWAW